MKARALYAQGRGLREIGRILGVPYDAIRYWCRITTTPDSYHEGLVECPRCIDPPAAPSPPDQYAYLLGQYLGDGHIVLTARVPVLRIACATAYPAIMAECETAMRMLLGRRVQRVSRDGCTTVQSCSKHWVCLFPQAGPGRKHERPIVLEEWQREIVHPHAGMFLRGLFHSDGCRVVNTVKVAGRLYEYPRWFFNNESRDILAIAGEALNILNVPWRMNRANSISVAKREAVSILDTFIGFKA
ncbi:transcriptional regulator [Catelliglobosispora koreensis]|uniref:transcriptional regulator n=1 Tax=Catelliglobosispora koreensis TaxID=129052 RepID=UPI001FE087ED|nr:transcriptional regulator [Catelliglobosispora koreensis]